MASTITVSDNSNRAGRIAIGVVVIALIIYWRVTGTIPSLLSGVMPEPPSGKVAGVYDFATNVLADLLAFTGSIVVALFTTIGALIMQVISWLIGKVSKPAAVESKPENPDMKVLFSYLAANVSTKQEMFTIASRVDTLEKRALSDSSLATKQELSDVVVRVVAIEDAVFEEVEVAPPEPVVPVVVKRTKPTVTRRRVGA